MEASSARVSQPLAVNTSEQNLSSSPSQSADRCWEVLEQDTWANACFQAPEDCWWDSSSAAGWAHAQAVEKWSPWQHLKAAPASECCPGTRALCPGSASRQERTQLPGPCTHLSALHSQWDHEGPFILRYEICVVSLLFFNETLFILGF